VTERSKAEAALRQAEAKYHALFDNAIEGIFQTTPEGTILAANPAMARMLGYESPEELIRERNDIARQCYADPKKREEFRSQIEKHGTVTGFEYECRRRDGCNIWVSENARAARDESGRVTHYEGTMEDITGRKRAEKERQRLQEQLTQAQKMESVGRLAGGVAHDFNNMLQAILGNVALALEDIPPESPLRESLEEIQKAAKRSADLTQQLLAFARKQTIVPRVLDLNDTVPGMLKMLRRLIGEDIHLAWMPGANLWQVKMDPSQIDQILANLCVNARDAITGTGKVTIETSA
jgi:PAS domain S-box-containing protein